MQAASILVALLVTGLIGSLGHCLGMCGPLLLLAGARFPRQGLAAAPLYLLYHTGRIAMYAVLGLVAGALGAVVWQTARNAVGSAFISLVLGGTVIIAGMAYLRWVRLPGAERLGEWWRSLARRVMQLPHLTGVLLLGVLNGLLPCDLVYGALVAAVAIGNPWLGALGMLLFGLGTIPALLVFGVGASMAAVPLRRSLARASGVLIMLVGLQLLLRGAATLGWLSHWMIGRVMIW